MIDPKEFFSAFQPDQFVKNLNAQYGWGEDEIKRAFEALLPAVWAGIRHTSSTPEGISSMMSALSESANPLASATAAANAWQPNVFMPWIDVSQKMFSSPDLQKAIAAQVADSTGLGQEALAAVMPTMTVLALGGIMRQFAFGPARTMIDSFMAGYARGRPEPAPSPVDFMAPYTDAMSAFFNAFTGGLTATPTEDTKQSDDQKPIRTRSKSKSEKQETKAAADYADEPIGFMPFNLDEVMKAGLAMQENQIKSFENLFSQFSPRGS